VLKPGGQVIVVEMASLQTGVPLSDTAGWLAKITGQAGPGPDLEQLLAEAGLRSRRETVEVDGSTAGLVVAER